MRSQYESCLSQVASLEAALSQAQAKLVEHANGVTVRASRADEERWRWQSEAEELRSLLAGRDRDIGRLQSKQEVCMNWIGPLNASLILATSNIAAVITVNVTV